MHPPLKRRSSRRRSLLKRRLRSTFLGLVALALLSVALSPAPAASLPTLLKQNSVTQKHAVALKAIPVKAVRQDERDEMATPEDFTPQMDADAAASGIVVDLDDNGNEIPGTAQTLAERNAYNEAQYAAALTADPLAHQNPSFP